MAARPRPLSPHLQVYKPQLTSVLSIMHRFTGLILSAAGVVLVLLILSIASGPDAYDWAAAQLRGVFGKLLLFAFLFSLTYHLLNGIRHLFWDAGHGFELKTVYASGWTTLILAAITSVGLCAWLFLGGAA